MELRTIVCMLIVAVLLSHQQYCYSLERAGLMQGKHCEKQMQSLYPRNTALFARHIHGCVSMLRSIVGLPALVCTA